jgi:hypothetical protein
MSHLAKIVGKGVVVIDQDDWPSSIGTGGQHHTPPPASPLQSHVQQACRSFSPYKKIEPSHAQKTLKSQCRAPPFVKKLRRRAGP